jgi:hypothetical protein
VDTVGTVDTADQLEAALRSRDADRLALLFNEDCDGNGPPTRTA